MPFISHPIQVSPEGLDPVVPLISRCPERDPPFTSKWEPPATMERASCCWLCPSQ